jgi:uncharacterized membrane protein
MQATELPLDLSQGDVVLPAAYDLAWSLIPLVVLLLAATVGCMVERRGGASWPQSILWFLLILIVPVLGFVIWVIYRLFKKRPAPHEHGPSTAPGREVTVPE